ncbi:hypothetical protein [Mycolicibacterium brumae]|uniref:ANTAR domain-containing protein n=1 Tax=Mycolicibacterium brumae TaxID=85968 RepID=A0A2G5PBQ4_9MYCO|nr:hypothetical protein [Mycolicibacterium brumae]MCV7191400.1 hypothetical protein [Mycolicibacterium brumae]PIB75782.1 hypothetical protein CQY22_008620 [Mycolicibacterium brumae]RWA16112.1 hypothetical protein MBRU_08360 [Mycolicibacterium brumae DSM 44177]UWW09492.1 hypothetical protein L2Z93_002594 [Mycolicibacterium brumae]
MPDVPDLPLQNLSATELAALICRAADELSTRGSSESFAEMLKVVSHVGERVGIAARGLASANSWSQVAQVSGTSKQAAWERWRM